MTLLIINAKSWLVNSNCHATAGRSRSRPAPMSNDKHDRPVEWNPLSSYSSKTVSHHPLLNPPPTRVRGQAMGIPFDSIRRPETAKTGIMDVSVSKTDGSNVSMDGSIDFNQQDPPGFSIPQDISRTEIPHHIHSVRFGSN